MFQQSRLFYLLVTVLVVGVFYLSGPFAVAKAPPTKRFSNADARLSRWIEVMSPPRRSLPLQHFHDHPYTPNGNPFRDQSQRVMRIKHYPLGESQLNRAEYLESHRKAKDAASQLKAATTPPKPVKAVVEEEIPDDFNEEVVQGSHRAAAAANPIQAAADASAEGAAGSDVDAEDLNPARIDDYSAPFTRIIQAATDPERTAADGSEDSDVADELIDSTLGTVGSSQSNDRMALDLDTTETAAADEGLKGHPNHRPEGAESVGTGAAAVDTQAPGEASVASIGEDHTAVKAPAAMKGQAATQAKYAPAAEKVQAGAKAAAAQVGDGAEAAAEKVQAGAKAAAAQVAPAAEKVQAGAKAAVAQVADGAEVAAEKIQAGAKAAAAQVAPAAEKVQAGAKAAAAQVAAGVAAGAVAAAEKVQTGAKAAVAQVAGGAQAAAEKVQAGAKAAVAQAAAGAQAAAADKRDPGLDNPDAVRNPLAERIPSKGKIGRLASPAEVKGAPLIREPYSEPIPDQPWATLDADSAQVIEDQALPEIAAQALVVKKRVQVGGVSENDV